MSSVRARAPLPGENADRAWCGRGKEVLEEKPQKTMPTTTSKPRASSSMRCEATDAMLMVGGGF